MQTGVDGMDNNLVMVVHPNILITPTLISETITCSKRTVLKSRMQSNGFTCKFKKILISFCFTCIYFDLIVTRWGLEIIFVYNKSSNSLEMNCLNTA